MGFERLTNFVPALLVPPNAHPYFTAGFLILAIQNYTRTFHGDKIHNNEALAFFRLALTPVAVWFFWLYAYGPFETPQSQVSVGMVVSGLYGMMKVFEVAVVSLFDEGPPRWVRMDGKVMDLPTTTKDRLFYALDLSTTLRGSSWYGDRYWDFAPKALVTYSSTCSTTRLAYLQSSAWSFAKQLVVVDICDSLNKSRVWNMHTTYPISSLSIPEQISFSLSVCVMTLLAITVTYTWISTIAVALGSSPSSWPPMFDRPFTATSLADFWSRRWHAIFRRCFDKISFFLLLPFPEPRSSHPTYYTLFRKVLRAVIIFTLSATLHILIMYRLDIDIRGIANMHPKKTFLDPAILKFFLAQPFGLSIEAFIVNPLVRLIFPSNKNRQLFVSRIWTWSFMLWAGRFWSDVWVHRGLWQPEETVVGYSIVRGLLYGKWVV